MEVSLKLCNTNNTIASPATIIRNFLYTFACQLHIVAVATIYLKAASFRRNTWCIGYFLCAGAQGNLALMDLENASPLRRGFNSCKEGGLGF